jgi:beta-galactosidase/beta-glucuronidase
MAEKFMLKKFPTIWMTALACVAANFGFAADWQPAKVPLMTRWAKDVAPDHVLPEYPRPQMTRAAWLNLDGLWDYATTMPDGAAPADYTGKILVPFCYESALSGVGKPSIPHQRLWYHRTFTVPAAWSGQRVILHCDAVNYDSAVWVNGQQVGTHRGGYCAFEFDITGQLKPGKNEIIVSAWNPLRSDEADAQVLGKQRVHPGGIFYTSATGIWQTLWLEPVPAAHITNVRLTPDLDAEALRLTVQASADAKFKVTALDGDQEIASATGTTGQELNLPIPHPHLWSPADPHLYNLKIELLADGKTGDEVGSYFAMRKISLGKDEQGRTRIFLNNKFLFEVGTLDQGYWPDGIYTAPTDEALRYDIEITKKLGFNLIRKHAKVEPPRWYYWTDKLGMLVWQDMPQMFGGHNGALTDEAKRQFETEWREELAEFHNHPSIVVWTTFNEGWGQHDTAKIVALTKQLDPSRLVNNASGWTDENVGDIHDTHDYPGPGCKPPEANRASVNGEFGGVTMSVPGHRWNDQVMGYGAVLQDSWLVTKRYQALLKNVYKLRDERGMSAAVYTQITDVEQEINGLLTYDRAVIKPDVAIITAANEGKFLPLPPNPNPPVMADAQDEPQSWQYTTSQPADDWMQPDFNVGDWKNGQSGFGHEVGSVHTGWTTSDIWLRRAVDLPADLPAKLAFDVFHDEDAEIYVNGVLAATTKGYNTSYEQIPLNEAGRAALKSGKNIIAVHCHQTTGGQYIDVGIVKAK